MPEKRKKNNTQDVKKKFPIKIPLKTGEYKFCPHNALENLYEIAILPDIHVDKIERIKKILKVSLF